jgi:hypothetical protein
MKVIALISFLAPLSLLASGLPNLDIQKLEGQYSQGSGTAQALFWQLPERRSVQNANFTVLKEQDSLVFSGDAGDYTLENLPELILNMNTLNWKAANFKMGPKSINLSLASLTGNSSTQNIRTNSLTLSCLGEPSASSLRDAALESCLKRGSLKANLIEFSNAAKSSSWMKSFFTAVLTNEATSKTGLEKLDFSISNGSFNLKLRAKLDISANIKGEGKIELRGAAGSRELRIRIDKVKASFLNVTKKVFEAIEDNPIDGVRVARPYVYLDLDS